MASSKQEKSGAAGFKSFLVTVRREKIVVFKSIVESHDNLATLRTEDSTRNILRIYFAPELEDEIDAMLAGLPADLEVKKLS
ncbi:MAG: DUF4911 domain-containing protein [Candidatus Binataceae bacterium]